ncbi:MAG: hypothetical protein HKN79_05175 [Flavobacteriales bacterium]|nr:hypothetical protein [Flavobacteriales bacterium]
MKLKNWLPILFISSALTVFSQIPTDSNTVYIQRDGVHVEALQEVVDIPEYKVREVWSDFISHRQDMSPSVQGLEAKEALTAHNSTIARAGNGSLELEMMVMGVDDESSIIRLYAKSDYQSAYPVEMESDTQETLDTLLQEFINYAESQSMDSGGSK